MAKTRIPTTQWVRHQRAYPAGKPKPPGRARIDRQMLAAVRAEEGEPDVIPRYRRTRPVYTPGPEFAATLPPNPTTNNSGKNKNRQKPEVLGDTWAVDAADITIDRLFRFFNDAVDTHGWEFALQMAKHHVGAALMWIALTDGYRAAYELAQQSADRIAPTAAQEAEQTFG